MKPSRPFSVRPFLSGTLLFLSCLLPLLLFSCAPVRLRIPAYPGSVGQFIEASRQKYNSMKGSFEFTLERASGQRFSAEAVTVVTPDSVNVRVYRMGLPVGDLESLAGRKKLDYIVYEEALRKALLWWDLDRYETERVPSGILVTGNGDVKLVLAPRTYVPVSQTITLPESELFITYSDYRLAGDFWYPYRIRIEYRGETLDLSAIQVELTRS